MRWRRIAFAGLAGVIVGWLVAEVHASRTQARLFHALARSMHFTAVPAAPLPAVSAGPGPALALASTDGSIAAFTPGASTDPSVAPFDTERPPRHGPYDERLGHDRVPDLAGRALARGFRLERAAQLSEGLRVARRLGLAAPYREKPQAGLRILGQGGQPLYHSAWPERIYPRFDDVPDAVVTALLFAENRELLDAAQPSRNPVLEWDRLALATVAYPFQGLASRRQPFGGSTLATQIQKFRHSPGGRTVSPVDKLRQILSASLQIYRTGEDTTAARREVVLDYLNGVPLAAFPGYGEVIGIPDGLRVWLGVDYAHVNALLDAPDADPAARGLAFRQVLSLILAAQRPSDFLRAHPEDLERRTDAYLALMAEAGALPDELVASAQAAGPIVLASARVEGSGPGARERQAAAPVRTALVPLLGESPYALDRLDLIAETTVHAEAQREIGELLHSLADPEVVRRHHLDAPRLLAQGDPAHVDYSFVLYERVDGVNRLRVQRDSLKGPFDLNDGSRMDFGSTAKLRTLLSYLEIVAGTHRAYAGRSPAELRAVHAGIDPSDTLSRWVVERLAERPGIALDALLEESLDRRHSASPRETFFTGSGLHRFSNFDEEDDERILTVREAFRRSVNLVFIRLMREVASHHVARQVGDPTRLLADATDPRRRPYLERHADREGRLHLARALRRHRDRTLDESLALILPPARRTPKRLAAVLRFVSPDASSTGFEAAMAAHGVTLDAAEAEALYAAQSPDRVGLLDRGHTVGVHPLELWLIAHRHTHPGDGDAEIFAASEAARAEATGWIFRTRRKHVADRAIRIAIEQDAFAEIHRGWRRLGYPFADLVPSYATAIGSSGDRPAALAELMGILVADGLREPSVRIERLRFAEDTPFEAVVAADPAPAQRVLDPEIARVTRGLLRDVVERGTASRIRGAIHAEDGSEIPIGGKTGTGDHRREQFARGGEPISSEVRARTACFAFTLGDRFFGVVTASVSGPEAAGYGFTSSLPVELLRVASPILERTLAGSGRLEAGASDPGAPREFAAANGSR